MSGAPHPRMHGITHVPGGPDPIPGLGGSGGAFETFRECVLANPNTVLFWPCDEPSGDLTDLIAGKVLTVVTADVSGTTYPLYGQTGPFTALPDQTAVAFAGVYGVLPADYDRFEISDAVLATIFNGTNPWTIDMWVEQLSLPTLTQGTLVELWNSGAGSAMLVYVNGSGNLAVGRAGTTVGLTAAENLALGEYVWVRVTYDGATLKLFMNQVEMDAAATATSFSGTGHYLSIGNGRETTGTPFNGRIADLAIYDDALTEFCTVSATGSGSADAGMVLTADGAGGTSWAYPTAAAEAKLVELKVVDDATAVTTGDGKLIFCVPAAFNGMNLTAAHAFVTTVSSSGLPTVQIRNITQTADMLTTRITIDASEFTSYSAAASPVVDTGNDDVATGDLVAVDVDVAGTGAKGLGVILTFTLP